MVLALILVGIVTVATRSSGVDGIPRGGRLPPFAVPLASAKLEGDANIATRANQGSAGSRPACSVRGPEILNVCELYEAGPLVLVLFVNAGSCADVLGDVQALAPSFPGVRFAGVAVRSGHREIRRLVRAKGLTLPIGFDRDGALGALYKFGSCPQVTLAFPGGTVQSAAILGRPSRSTLRARIGELVAESRARGWRPARGRV